MKKPFMRKHVKQMPHVSGVKLELDDRIDVVIRGKHRYYRVKDAIETIPCILKWRIENPHTKCGGSAVKPKHGQNIRLVTHVWTYTPEGIAAMTTLRCSQTSAPGFFKQAHLLHQRPLLGLGLKKAPHSAF